MKYALDPETFRPISPEVHALRKKVHGKNAICGVCKAEVFDHSVKSIQIISHFNHVADSGPCRLKVERPDSDTSDYSGDGKQLRQDFFKPEMIQLAFSVCQSMVCGVLRGDRYVEGNFTVGRYKELLHNADEKRTWSLKSLTPKLVPFVLVANEVFDLKISSVSGRYLPVTFILDKSAMPVQTRRFDRNISVDPTKPIYLVKRFMKDNGTPGSQVKSLDPDNPYLVSEESAERIAGPNWQRLSLAHIAGILKAFNVA
jgi:hypothetical protein